MTATTEALGDASVDAPSVTLTADDARHGRVARLQAQASERHGAVLRGNVPLGPDAGPCLFLAGQHMAEAVLLSRRHAFSSDLGWRDVLGRGCGQAILNTDDPLHVEQRRIWAPALSGAMLRSHERGIGRFIDSSLDRLDVDADIDAYAVFRALAFRAVAGTIGGLAEEMIEPAFRAITPILDGQDYQRESRDSYLERATACRAALAGILTDTIAHRRRHRREMPESLLDVLLEHPSLAADDDELRSHLTILLIAGHDTGATLYSRAMHLLAQMPPVAALLAGELAAAGSTATDALSAEALDALPHLDHFMLEVGRLYPPLINLPRYTTEDIALGGYRIAAGTRVAVAAGATHLLASAYADPLAFDMDRYADPAHAERTRPFLLLTFSGGARLCAGIRFAQVEFKAIVSRVLARFSPTADAGRIVPHAGFWNARPAAPLTMRLVPRQGT